MLVGDSHGAEAQLARHVVWPCDGLRRLRRPHARIRPAPDRPVADIHELALTPHRHPRPRATDPSDTTTSKANPTTAGLPADCTCSTERKRSGCEHPPLELFELGLGDGTTVQQTLGRRDLVRGALEGRLTRCAQPPPCGQLSTPWRGARYRLSQMLGMSGNASSLRIRGAVCMSARCRSMLAAQKRYRRIQPLLFQAGTARTRAPIAR